MLKLLRRNKNSKNSKSSKKGKKTDNELKQNNQAHGAPAPHKRTEPPAPAIATPATIGGGGAAAATASAAASAVVAATTTTLTTQPMCPAASLGVFKAPAYQVRCPDGVVVSKHPPDYDNLFLNNAAYQPQPNAFAGAKELNDLKRDTDPDKTRWRIFKLAKTKFPDRFTEAAFFENPVQWMSEALIGAFRTAGFYSDTPGRAKIAMEIFYKCITHGADLRQILRESTLLIGAAEYGFMEGVKLLITGNTMIDGRQYTLGELPRFNPSYRSGVDTDEECTALLMAGFCGQEEVIHFLLANGASISERTQKHEFGLLDKVIHGGNFQLARKLIVKYPILISAEFTQKNNPVEMALLAVCIESYSDCDNAAQKEGELLAFIKEMREQGFTPFKQHQYKDAPCTLDGDVFKDKREQERREHLPKRLSERAPKVFAYLSAWAAKETQEGNAYAKAKLDDLENAELKTRFTSLGMVS